MNSILATSMGALATSAPLRSAGAVVEFSGIGKQYGPFTALHPTDLRVERGEFLAIIGPSGSGKSTLLGVVAGFTEPSCGAVLVNGHNVVSLAPHARNFGMVFQGYALFPHMTVAQNIAFPLRMRGLSKKDIASKVAKALEMVRLDNFAERSPAMLSGGQQQRVALARAAVYEPPLLLMDEPLGALDKNLREEMQDEIKALQRKLGCTVIYVTHDQQEAATMADRLAVMRGGRIEQLGTPRAIYEYPHSDFVAGFLGEASLLPVISVQSTDAPGVKLAVAEGGLPVRIDALEIPDRPVAICLRPENISLGAAAAGCDNQFEARVVEAMFTTGSVRYRVRLERSGALLTVRVASHPALELLATGTAVRVGWNTAMAALVNV
jgi:putative spermidine/putrescine transport system ATP-binding protein